MRGRPPATNARTYVQLAERTNGPITQPVAAPDVCTLANNHVLDHGRHGLEETLDALASAGIPADWAATLDRPGVAVVDEPLSAQAAAIAERIDAWKQPGDIVVVSVHWGTNWGYEATRHQTRFAHGLLEGGVDVLRGHSSHHPRPIEVHRDRLILYGCGDLINDYEGIPGHGSYRVELGADDALVLARP